MTDGLKRLGFTIIELLTVLAIIALLTGILVPSLNRVRRLAKETKQKAQLTAIDQAMLTFRNDYGDYPPSGQRDEDTNTQLYNGAMKLAEALVGWDLMGFHPNSAWRPDGLVAGGGSLLYNASASSLNARVGPYLEVSKANVFTLRQIFGNNNPAWLPLLPFDPDNFMLCDSFPRTKILIEDNVYKPGLPILYFRATRSKGTMGAGSPLGNIYNSMDNSLLVMLKDKLDNDARIDKLGLLNISNILYDPTYKIIDQKVWQVQNVAWPYRPDSYILISAGVDGEYGTQDDITNCGN